MEPDTKTTKIIFGHKNSLDWLGRNLALQIDGHKLFMPSHAVVVYPRIDLAT